MPKKTVSGLHLWGQLAYWMTHLKQRHPLGLVGCGLCVHTHKKGGLCHGFFTHLAIPSTLTSFIVGNEWSSYSSSQKMWRIPTVILAALFRLLPRCNIKMDSVFLKGIKSPWSGFSFPFLPIPAGDCFGELLSPWSPSPNTTSRL